MSINLSLTSFGLRRVHYRKWCYLQVSQIHFKIHDASYHKMGIWNSGGNLVATGISVVNQHLYIFMHIRFANHQAKLHGTKIWTHIRNFDPFLWKRLKINIALWMIYFAVQEQCLPVSVKCIYCDLFKIDLASDKRNFVLVDKFTIHRKRMTISAHQQSKDNLLIHNTVY